MQPPSPNTISQGQHLASKAVDYRSAPDPYIYAPEELTFLSYGQEGQPGTMNDAGLALKARGASGVHQFAHTSESYFRGGAVPRGTRIAKMGHTGYTIPSGPAGAHLHYWVLTPGGYVYPPNLYTQPFKANIEDKGEPMVNKGDVENMAGIAGWKPPQNYINFWGDDKHTWHDFMYDLTKQQEFKNNLAKKYGSAEAQAKLNKIKELLQ